MANDVDEAARAGYPAPKPPSLRQKAEQTAMEREGLSACDSRAASQEEMRQKAHELLVHQIELEMQNDELRFAQEELEEARARYLDLYDLAPVGYCTLDEDGLIVEANLTAAGMLGVPRGALICKPIAHFIHRDEQDVFYLYKRQLFETGEPQSFELKMTNSGGASFWAQLAANVTRDADGELKCRITVSDITERKLAEKALAEERQRLFDVLESLPVMICLLTPDRRIVFDNRLFRVKFGESGGRHCYEYCCGFDRPCDFCESFVPLTTGRPHHWEFMSPDGNTIIDAYDFPFSDTDGSPLILEMDIDITKRKRAEEALQASEAQAHVLAEALEKKNRLVTDFFINISHELKTPITLIKLALEIIESYLQKPKLNRAGMIGRTAIMKQNANRLSRLVGNILDITKIDAGFMEPKFAYTDIVGLIHGLVDSMDSFAQKKELKIEFKSSVKAKRIMTDSQIVERVILNLVSNAIKHTREGGCIQISCTDMKSSIVVCVKDNGEGIPDEKKPIVFDRFRQVNTSLTRSSEGTGIGLSLTKALVELLRGRIWFESTLGAGSEFFVEFPVLQMAEQSQPIEQLGMTIDKQVEMEFSDIDFG